jgi:hypothetical protein
MLAVNQATKRTYRFVLAGLVAVGLLSACGGGSGTGGAARDDHELMPINNPLNKYIGAYTESGCFSLELQPGVLAAVSFASIISESSTPNTANFEDIAYFYQADTDYDPQCIVKIGTATASGILTYEGTLPSVPFIDPSRLPLEADKLQAHYTNLVIEGQVGFGFDNLSQYPDSKGLFAIDGNTLYSGDRDYLDAEGYPTKLDTEDVATRD